MNLYTDLSWTFDDQRFKCHQPMSTSTLMTLWYIDEMLLKGYCVIWPIKNGLCLLSGSTNVLEAASQGASNAVGLVANIVVNLIAFLALLAFFDGVLSWVGGMLDCPQLSFSVKALTRHTCTYALWCKLILEKYSNVDPQICNHTPFASLCFSFSSSAPTCSCRSHS